MRLTEKDKVKVLLTFEKNNVRMTDAEHKELKLGQLEDIEEELGIDFITLFKAYKQGFHIKYEDGLRGFVHGGEYYLEICLETKAFKMKEFPNGTKWYFKDYGKTWALTKEELK